MGGIFTISLDFELHWGVFDKKNRDERHQVYETTLSVVPKMLELFSDAQVHATWAVVGSMFARNRGHWERLKPDVLPSYTRQAYSAYRYINENGLPEQSYRAHFAPAMIKLIHSYKGQEVGTHTFSHFYCLEEQSEPMAFEADLKAAISCASEAGIELNSLVFPRNQFNPEYLRICYDLGITTVRSNPETWFWSPVTNTGSGMFRKISRFSDAYIQLGNHHTSYSLNTIKQVQGEPLCLPASRFLRPWNPKYQFANNWRIRRVCNEIIHAAQHGECYHLWWHPENFGTNAEKNLEGLRTILKTFQYCKKQFNMASWNMGEYAANLIPKVKTSQDAAVHV